MGIFHFLDGFEHELHHGFEESSEGFVSRLGRWLCFVLLCVDGIPVALAELVDADVMLPELICDLFDQNCLLCGKTQDWVNWKALGDVPDGWVRPFFIDEVDEGSLLNGAVGNSKSGGCSCLLDVLPEWVASVS